MRHESSANHDYVLATALSLAQPTKSPCVLDFGCGTGALITKAREQGLDFWGADTYSGGWQDASDKPAAAFIRAIMAGRVPYPDDHFDVVVTNMVFEHVPWPNLQSSLIEICRVTKPTGALLMLFPTADVWFEGHLGVYLPHKLRRWPRAQSCYLSLCHRLGFGYHRTSAPTRTAWVEAAQNALSSAVFHHDFRDFRVMIRDIFGEAPTSLAPDYMRFRLARSARLKTLTSVPLGSSLDGILEFVCHRRAGRVLTVRRATATISRQMAH
jgi:SAM-dependent methyltransferase